MFVLHLEEGDVDEGGIEVDELKWKHHCHHLYQRFFHRQRHLYCHRHHESHHQHPR